MSISSRPFLFFAGRRQVGQVASPPARSLSPARPAPVSPRDEPQPHPGCRAARAPRARLTRVRLAAGWPILCNKRRRGPPLAPPPPRRRPPALDPPAAPGQHPISTPLQTLSSTFPFTFTSSNPPPPAPRASCASTRHTPPKPPPVVELAHLCVLLASLVHILLSTTQLFRVRVRGGARAGSRGWPPGGATAGSANVRRDAPDAPKRPSAPRVVHCGTLGRSRAHIAPRRAPSSPPSRRPWSGVGREGPMRLQPPCLAVEPVRSDSSCSSDRDGMLTRCKLLERAAGAVDARGDAPQRLETSIRYKMRLRSRELTRDSMDVIRCND